MSQWSEKQTSGCKEVRRAEVRRVVGRRQEWAWAPHTPSELSRHSRWGAPGRPHCSHRWASHCPVMDGVEVGRPLGLGSSGSPAGLTPNAALVNPPSLLLAPTPDPHWLGTFPGCRVNVPSAPPTSGRTAGKGNGERK